MGQLSKFYRDTLKLSGGSALSQFITLISAPLLYRIFSSEAYGVLATLLAVSAILMTISTAQFVQAIMIEKKEENVLSIVIINTGLNLIFFIIIVCCTLVFKSQITELFGLKHPKFLYFLPFFVLHSSQTQIFTVWANREGHYSAIATSLLMSTFISAMVSAILGLLDGSTVNLLFGAMSGQLVSMIYLLYIMLNRTESSLGLPNIECVRNLIVNHKDLMFYHLPSDLLNKFTNQGPVFLISNQFGPTVVGYYALSVRMLGLPMLLIGNPVGQTFYQKATKAFNNGLDFNDLFVKILTRLLIVAVTFYLFVAFLGDRFFKFVFGTEWLPSAEIAGIMVFYFSAKLVVSPLSITFIVVNRFKENLLWNIYLCLSILILFWYSKSFDITYLEFIEYYTVNYLILYGIWTLRCYHFSDLHTRIN